MTFVCLICLVSHFTSYLFLSLFNAAGDYSLEKPGIITGSPSSKYEHRHCCVTFELNRFVGGEKPIVSVTYQYERFSTEKKRKNGLPYLKCVRSFLCDPRAYLCPFYGFQCHRFSLQKGKDTLFPRIIAVPRLIASLE